MASILSTTLTFGSRDGSPIANVDLSLEFTVREVSENFTYGINVAVVRLRPDQVIVTRHKGYTAMEFFALPSDPNANLQVAYAMRTVTPNGVQIMNLVVEAAVYGSVASGERLQALVTVVPEIAETTNLSPLAAYP